MRICIIPPDQKAAHPDHISSGQERVARDQARLLTQAGHEVDYWTVNTEHDLSPLRFNHRIMVDIQPRAFFNSSRPNPQTKSKREWCREHYTEYDIFLCHTDSSVFLKELTRLGVGHRIISFIHAPFAGTMWGIGFNSGQGRARWGGATIVAVSERCKNHWNKWSSSTKKRLESPDPGYISRPDLLNKDVVFEEFVTEVLCPQYSTASEEILHGENGPLVLSRIAPEKKIHVAFDTGSTFICRTDNKKYLEKIQDKLLREQSHIDRPYSECMQYLRSASVLISTWADETSGINAFEAAERGVPVILCESGEPHASREFLPEWAFITCEDNHQSVVDALSRIPAEWKTMEFRSLLAETLRSGWSEAAYSKKLNALVERVYARVKNTPVSPRDFGGDLVEPIGTPKVKERKHPQVNACTWDITNREVLKQKDRAIIYIYAIKINGQVRIVGESDDPRERIPNGYRWKTVTMLPDSAVTIQKLQQYTMENGNEVHLEVEILEECSFEDRRLRESYWIEHFRQEGHDLWNATKPVKLKKEPKPKVEKIAKAKVEKTVTEAPTDFTTVFETNGFNVLPSDGTIKKAAFMVEADGVTSPVVVLQNRWGIKKDWQGKNVLLAVGFDGKIWMAEVDRCIEKVQHTGTWQNKGMYSAGAPSEPLFTPL